MKRILLTFFALCASAFGTLSSGVAISSITVSSGVATVTTVTAHGIPANNPGGYITGSSQSTDNIAFAAASVPSSTTLTINSSVMVACSSSCGTLFPAELFVIKSATPIFGATLINGCMWTFSPVGAAAPTSQTGCAGGLPTQLPASEVNAALQSGQWLEITFSRDFSTLYATTTIQNQLLDKQFSAQLAQTNGTQPGSPSGKTCDATGCN